MKELRGSSFNIAGSAIIVAPHPDDEIIGAWRVIDSIHHSDLHIVYGDMTFGFDPTEFTPPPILDLHAYSFFKEHTNDLDFWTQPNTTYFFPDPIFETHPAHRFYGSFGEELLRKARGNTLFYSVNMQAPYIEELPTELREAKRKCLDTAYPEKADLWKYDHKYFLFEGFCMWLL